MATLLSFSLPKLTSSLSFTAVSPPNLRNSALRRQRLRCSSSAPELSPNPRQPQLLNLSPAIKRVIMPCGCGRRRLMESMGALALIHAFPPCACSRVPVSDSPQDVLNEFHPSKPDWYEELFATAMSKWTGSYEADVASYKAQLFAQLRGKAKDFLEIGIGAGPNLKYYAGDAGVSVIGADPNRKMEKYVRATAEAAGLPSSEFQFIQAVGEALPLPDASVDAVIGTLVLCSVKDVSRTLSEVKRVLRPGGYFLFLEHVAAKDGTLLRFVQNILNPLQQFVADGCHLSRETGNYIAEAGFSEVDSSMVSISSASIINPQLYGIARK